MCSARSQRCRRRRCQDYKAATTVPLVTVLRKLQCCRYKRMSAVRHHQQHHRCWMIDMVTPRTDVLLLLRLLRAFERRSVMSSIRTSLKALRHSAVEPGRSILSFLRSANQSRCRFSRNSMRLRDRARAEVEVEGEAAAEAAAAGKAAVEVATPASVAVAAEAQRHRRCTLLVL